MNPQAMFDRCVAFVIRIEGGLGEISGDPGGLTKYGISQRAYPDVDIAALTLDDAKAIYLRDYWVPARCWEFRPAIALALFDGCVNHGVIGAVRILQESVGTRVDGRVGPMTIGAAWKAPVRELLVEYLGRRGVLYDKNPADHLGWYKRLCDVAIEAMTLEGDNR